MHLWSQATVDIHHAALSSLFRPLRLRSPGVSIPSFPGIADNNDGSATNDAADKHPRPFVFDVFAELPKPLRRYAPSKSEHLSP
jgi:hypothetical protein